MGRGVVLLYTLDKVEKACQYPTNPNLPLVSALRHAQLVFMSTSISAISEGVGRCLRHSPHDTSTASERAPGHDTSASQSHQFKTTCSIIPGTSIRNCARSGTRQTRIRDTSHWLTRAGVPSFNAAKCDSFLQTDTIGCRQSFSLNPDSCSPSFPQSGARSRKSSSIRCYMDSPKDGPVKRFFKTVQSSLPIVGLLSRLIADEGGVGSDHLRLPEFRRKVEKLSTSEAAMAYSALEQRYGKVMYRFNIRFGSSSHFRLHTCFLC